MLIKYSLASPDRKILISSRKKINPPQRPDGGKKLDFIVQEMNREANTTGSKCQDLAITNMVVDLKAEIEKIREQIQNIE